MHLNKSHTLFLSIYRSPPLYHSGVSMPTAPPTRRKNATRENTHPLKEWLGAHLHNPYPTKPEKIVLAVASRMSLTQVSTWFANARRRLKKENKAIWCQRNSSRDHPAVADKKVTVQPKKDDKEAAEANQQQHLPLKDPNSYWTNYYHQGEFNVNF